MIISHQLAQGRRWSSPSVASCRHCLRRTLYTVRLMRSTPTKIALRC